MMIDRPHIPMLALSMAAAGIDAAELQRRFDSRIPRRTLAAFLAATGLMLVVSELGQIVPALAGPVTQS